MEFFEAIKNRRTYYNLKKTSKISDERIEEIVKEGVKHTPSAYNTQTSHALVAFGDNHDKIWDIAKEALINKIGLEKYNEGTKDKIESFKNSHCTVLFFINQEELEKYEKDYSPQFSSWGQQSVGMAQYAVWTGLETEGVGVNLQHYNPLIDEEIRKFFNLPSSLKLISQMVVGDKSEPAGQKDFKDIDELVKIYK